MIAQIATAQELKADRDVIYIDYEDSARNVVKTPPAARRIRRTDHRSPALRRRPIRRSPRQPHQPARARNPRLADTATLAIIDGVTSCLAYAGLDSNSGDDIAAWYNTMPRLISHAGQRSCSSTRLKSKDNRGSYAGGSMQKLALIDGISYSVDMTKPVGKGVRGTIVIKSGKDRISEIEEHCTVSWSSNGSHLREAARIENQQH